MLNQRERAAVVLKALEDRQIEVAAVDIAGRSRLMDDPDRSIADRARRLFQDQSSDRAKVVQSYGDVLKLSGDEQRGKKVFDTNCARCHMPRVQGGRVGPDLSGVNNKSKQELLTSILNPSYAIEPHFVQSRHPQVRHLAIRPAAAARQLALHHCLSRGAKGACRRRAAGATRNGDRANRTRGGTRRHRCRRVAATAGRRAEPFAGEVPRADCAVLLARPHQRRGCNRTGLPKGDRAVSPRPGSGVAPQSPHAARA